MPHVNWVPLPRELCIVLEIAVQAYLNSAELIQVMMTRVTIYKIGNVSRPFSLLK